MTKLRIQADIMDVQSAQAVVSDVLLKNFTFTGPKDVQVILIRVNRPIEGDLGEYAFFRNRPDVRALQLYERGTRKETLGFYPADKVIIDAMGSCGMLSFRERLALSRQIRRPGEETSKDGGANDGHGLS